jgi:predicted acyl esterase
LDSYWAQYSPTNAEYSKMDIPILTITGHYDADQKGAMLYYRRHLENAEVLTFVTIYFLFK